jgi:hypothetical protein
MASAMEKDKPAQLLSKMVQQGVQNIEPQAAQF